MLIIPFMASAHKGQPTDSSSSMAAKQKSNSNPWDRDWVLDSGKVVSETRLKFYEDQQKGTESVLADLSIFCEGGFILAHKIILCPVSKFIRETVMNQDSSSKTASVAMLQYNVESVLPIINFLYTGKMVFKWSEFNVMQMVVNKMELNSEDINFSQAVRANTEDRKHLQKITFVPLMEYEGIPTSNSKPVRFATIFPQ